MRKHSIIAASTSLLTRRGLAGWTIDEVATDAHCAKGLVLYHFQTKQALLDRSAEGLVAGIHEERIQALGGGAGPAGLDRLWRALVLEVESGRFAASMSLRAMGLPTGAAASHEGLRAAVATSLDVAPEVLAEGVAIAAMLDGLALQLLARRPEDQVREAYDQLWVSMVTLD